MPLQDGSLKNASTNIIKYYSSQWSARIYQGLQLPENICETQGFGDMCLSLGKESLAFTSPTERAAIMSKTAWERLRSSKIDVMGKIQLDVSNNLFNLKS